MKQRVLPLVRARTMLDAVPGSRSLPGSLTRRALLGALSLGVLSPVRALAQPLEDSGWFDPPPDAGVADPPPADAYQASEVESAPSPVPADVPDTDPSALTTFRPALDPYGRWVADPTYGTVWVPHAHAVGADFAPYVSRGHWALTADDDWIWVSDYPFGWAVFHYGRWVWISGHGWSWVPGRTYANAWVVWRVPTAGYAYVGWAPMPPSWVWVNGAAISLWYAPPVPYVFCHSSFIFDYHVHTHIVRDRRTVHTIASHTHVYPTPYRAPARPSARTAASPSARASRPSPSSAPRGPVLSAARIPPSAVPAQRTAPPPAATRLSGARRITASSRDLTPQRDTWTSRPSRQASERLAPETRRSMASEPVRSTTTTGSSRAAVPVDRSRSTVDRSRSTADRVRSAPSAPSRARAVEPRSVAPSRARAPARDFAPSMSPVRRSRRP